MLSAADAINGDTALREQLMILVLGNCARPEIAERLTVEEALVAVWEAVYFDVRDSLEATGWIFRSVVRPELDRGNGALAAKLKHAHAGGPVAAKAVLDLDTRAPISAGERLFDRKLKLHLKLAEAAEAPLASARDANRFTSKVMDLQHQERRLELEQQKLAARCEESLRKHELAEQRLQFTEQREQARIRRVEERARRKREEQQRLDSQRQWLEDQLRSKRDAAVARAASSPLAELTWGESTASKTTSQERIPGRHSARDPERSAARGTSAEVVAA